MFSRQLYNTDGITINKETMDLHNLSAVLAWAADRNISYDMALKSLVSQEIPLIFRLLSYCISPIFHTSLIRRNQDGFMRRRIAGIKPFFRSAIETAITELQMGYRLSDVLERNLRWWLPEHYIHSIALAEDKGCVPETLKQLAKTSTKVKRRRKEILSVLIYPFLVMIFSVYLIWGMMVYIIPKFEKIFLDLLGDVELPALTRFVTQAADYALPHNPITLLFLLQFPWVIYYLFCTHRADWILVKIPFLKRAVLRWQKLDAIQALSVYTRMKIPTHEALDIICSQLLKSPLKKKFETVRDEVVNGKDFIESWKKVFPKDTLEEFYLRNGYKTDKLSDNLDQLATCLQDEDNRKHDLLMKSSEPVLLFGISLTIGIIVIAMFQPMIYLVSLLSDMAK